MLRKKRNFSINTNVEITEKEQEGTNIQSS